MQTTSPTQRDARRARTRNVVTMTRRVRRCLSIRLGHCSVGGGIEASPRCTSRSAAWTARQSWTSRSQPTFCRGGSVLMTCWTAHGLLGGMGQLGGSSMGRWMAWGERPLHVVRHDQRLGRGHQAEDQDPGQRSSGWGMSLLRTLLSGRQRLRCARHLDWAGHKTTAAFLRTALAMLNALLWLSIAPMQCLLCVPKGGGAACHSKQLTGCAKG